MRSLIRRLSPGSPAADVPRPARPICLIGDIHGRADLLKHMLTQITEQPDGAAARIVVLGDMIDRGPDSAGVLKTLHALQTQHPTQVTCLMGNHERMMLDFITSPDIHVGWLRNGGDKTVASYGLNPSDAPERLSEGLSEAIPGAIRRWISQLPMIWTSDRVMAVHAGADPRLTADQQTEHALLWGHPDFGRKPRRDAHWVVCGHVIVPEPVAAHGRISVDTGAWHSGVLSAAWLNADGVKFLQARGD